MTRHHQRDKVRLDIGDVREEDETCVDENNKEEILTWTRSAGRDIVMVIVKDETSSW